MTNKIISTPKIIAVYLISFLFIILEFLPIYPEIIKLYFPLISACFIFYFYIVRFNILSYLFVLIIAIIADSVNGSTIGTHPLIYFILIYISQFQNKIFLYKNFKEIWLALAIFLLEFTAFKMLFLLNESNIFNYRDIILQIILTIIIYPILHQLMFEKIYNLFKQENK